MQSYTLYGKHRSYFTRKLEFALLFYGIDYQFQNIDATNFQMLQEKSGTHQMPVLQTPEGEFIADTTPIIQKLDEQYPNKKLFRDGPTSFWLHLFEEYFDEWIARTAVHFRWNYPEHRQQLSMDLGNNIPQIAESIKTWGLKACRATGVTSEIQKQACEDEYFRILTAIEKQLSQTKYLFGDEPTVVDAVVIGGLIAHFYYDPVPKARIQNHYPLVSKWCDDAFQLAAKMGELDEFKSIDDQALLDNPFSQFLLKVIEQTYIPFALANKQAVETSQKSFFLNMYGEEVSYKARSYVEESREMLVKRVVRLNSTSPIELSDNNLLKLLAS